MNTSHCAFEQNFVAAYSIKKGALSSSEDERSLYRQNTGCQDAYLISSATGYPFRSGSVALRHQITLVLPVRRTSIYRNRRSTNCSTKSELSEHVVYLLKKIVFRRNTPRTGETRRQRYQQVRKAKNNLFSKISTNILKILPPRPFDNKSVHFCHESYLATISFVVAGTTVVRTTGGGERLLRFRSCAC